LARGLEKIIDWKALDCQVSAWTDSLEACQAALPSPPHILITDIRIPGMDGLGLVSRLRDTGTTMQAILLSGYSDFEHAERALSWA